MHRKGNVEVRKVYFTHLVKCLADLEDRRAANQTGND